MLVLVNPYAGGGTALKKWDALDDVLLDFSDHTRGYVLEHSDMFGQMIKDAFQYGERDFVAAGGDGTVNLVLNNLIPLIDHNPNTVVRLGAIGLGSSNDFHKPFYRNRISNGIPYKLDFYHARLRDIGCVRFYQDGRWIERYFISNASAGVTAKANYSFNNPDSMLKFLKHVHTPSAIFYAALKTIFTYRNIQMTIRGLENDEFTTDLTNLAILKNPHVSGSFCYQSSLPLDNGILTVNLCHDMSTIDLLKLLWTLCHDGFQSMEKCKSWFVSGFTLQSLVPFAIELDGEVIKTTDAEFTVLPRFIKVCQ